MSQGQDNTAEKHERKLYGRFKQKQDNAPTPETDASAFDVLLIKGEVLHGPTRDGDYTTSEHSRRLERQRDEALRRLAVLADPHAPKTWNEMVDHIATLRVERDEALRDLAAVRESADAYRRECEGLREVVSQAERQLRFSHDGSETCSQVIANLQAALAATGGTK